MEALGIDRERVAALKEREDAAFADAHAAIQALWERAKPVMPNGVPMTWLRTSYDHPPLFVDDGLGAHFRDVDGHEYADFNIADMSMFTGYGPAPVVEAVSRQVGRGVAVPAADRGLDLGRRASWRGATACRCGSSRWRRRAPTPR